MKKIIFIIIMYLSLGCNRKIVLQDRIIKDTLVTKEITVDTFKLFDSYRKDTIYFTKEKIKTRLIIHKDTIFNFTKIESDTIIREITTKGEVYYKEKEYPFWFWVIIGGFVSIILIMIKKK